MKLIVGLGNPGKKYENTRHNFGFRVIDKLVIELSGLSMKEKFGGQLWEGFYNEEKIILLKPLKYMNLSGDVINKIVKYYNVDINDVLIVHDDLDLSFGVIKLKINSGSGGHKGLKNIEENFNTINYKRLKIGIGNNKVIETKKYVLGKLTKEEKNKEENVLGKVVTICKDFLILAFEELMNKYN